MKYAAFFASVLSVNLFLSCKTPNGPAEVKSSEVSDSIAKKADAYNGCFGVTKAESDLTSQDVKRLMNDTKKICISEIVSSGETGPVKDKIIVALKADSDKVLKEFRFKEATPARCMGCYIFSKSDAGSGTFSSTGTTGSAKMGLNIKSFGGKIQFMMIRDLGDNH